MPNTTKANGKETAVRGNPKRYGALLAEALPAVIKTDADNEKYLAIVEKLMRKGEENLTPEEDTLLDLLVHLIHDFETCYYKPRHASPLEVLHFLMESNGLKQADLAPVIGSKGLTSDIVNGKRAISKANAKALGEFFKISPAAFI
jgi:HTH-type transcriptional regulator/antitoxin HigA